MCFGQILGWCPSFEEEFRGQCFFFFLLRLLESPRRVVVARQVSRLSYVLTVGTRPVVGGT